MSIGLYIVLAPLYLKSVRKLQEKRFVFVKILAIIIPENGAKVSKIKCFQFAQQTLDMNKIIIDLDVVMKEKGISKNSVCKNCNLQRTQLNNYCKNKISRIDLKILARLCEYLKCDLTDILKLVEEEEENS